MAQAATGNTTSSHGAGSSSTSAAITVAAGESLVICIVIEDPATTIDSVTWDLGTPENFVESPIALYVPPHDRQSVHIWNLLAPTAGTDTITVTLSEAQSHGAITTVIINGDSTTLLSGRVVVEGDIANSLTVSPNQGADDLGFAVFGTRAKENLTTDAGTELFDLEADNSFNMSVSSRDGTGALDITVSNATSSECEMVGMVINGDSAAILDAVAGSISIAGIATAFSRDYNLDAGIGSTSITGPVTRLLTFGDFLRSDWQNVSTVTVTSDLGSNPKSGNLLLLAIGGTSGAADPLATPPGDGFAVLHDVDGDSTWAWYWKISDGTEQTVAVTWTNSATQHGNLYAEYQWDNKGIPVISKNENQVNINTEVNSQASGAVTPNNLPNIVVAFHASDLCINNFDSQAINGNWIEDIGFENTGNIGLKFSSLSKVSGSQEATHSDSDIGDAMYGAIAAFSAPPTFTIEQAATGDADYTATSSISKAFTSNVTIGNYIVVGGCAAHSASHDFIAGDCTKASGTATIGTVRLAVQNGFTLTEVSLDLEIGLWYAEVTGSGSLTMEVNSNNTADVTGIALMEVSTDGVWAADPLEDSNSVVTDADDQTSFNAGNLTAASSGVMIGVAATAHAVAEDVDPDTGWTQGPNFAFRPGDDTEINMIYRLVDNETLAPSWTITTPNDGTAQAGLLLKASSGGGDPVLDAVGGAFTVTGIVASLEKTYILNAEIGTASVAGSAATLEFHDQFSSETGVFALAGVAANLEIGYSINAIVGAFNINGIAATLSTIGDIIKSDRFEASSATMTSDLGSNPASGNLLILAIGASASAESLDTPPGDGFAEISRGDTGGGGNWFWYWKISDGTEQTAAVTWSGSLAHANLYVEYSWDGSTPVIVKNEDESGLDTVVTSQVTGAATPDSSPNICLAFHGADQMVNVFDGAAIDGSWIEDFSIQNNSSCGVILSRLLNAVGSQEATFSTTDTGDQMYGAIAIFSISTSNAQTLHAFRWFADGTEAGAAALADQNIDITQPGSVIGVYRGQINNSDDPPSEAIKIQVKLDTNDDSTYRDVPVAP